ncbi:MAG: protein kinase family protein [Planctomycetota bacterium]
MGTVYRAEDASGETVAVKVLHAHLLRTTNFRERGQRGIDHHADRMEARFLLWQATEDRVHLRAAHDLLLEICAYASEEARDGGAGYPDASVTPCPRPLCATVS